MAELCERHRHLSADYGTCAPLHIPDPRSERQIADCRARDRLSKASAKLVEASRLYQIANVAMRPENVALESHPDVAAGRARSARIQARALVAKVLEGRLRL